MADPNGPRRTQTCDRGPLRQLYLPTSLTYLDVIMEQPNKQLMLMLLMPGEV